MYTIKTLNAISPVGLAKLPANQFEIDNEAAAPQGILVRSADILKTPLPDSLLAIAPRRCRYQHPGRGMHQCRYRGVQHPRLPMPTPWQSWSSARWWRAPQSGSMLSTGRRPSRGATPSPGCGKGQKYLSAQSCAEDAGRHRAGCHRCPRPMPPWRWAWRSSAMTPTFRSTPHGASPAVCSTVTLGDMLPAVTT